MGLFVREIKDPFKTKRRDPRYSFEIDCSGTECDKYEPLFSTYDVISTEGNTLEECIDNAIVFIIDQDGGNFPECTADEDWMIEAITDKFHEVSKNER